MSGENEPWSARLVPKAIPVGADKVGLLDSENNDENVVSTIDEIIANNIQGYQFLKSASGVNLIINFSPSIDMDAIAAIKVKITASSSTATDFFLRINGLSTAIYSYNGMSVNTTPAVLGQVDTLTTDGILLIPEVAVGGGDAVQMNFELTKDPLGSNFGQLVCQTHSALSGVYNGGGFISSNISSISSLELNLPNGGTIDGDSLIEVWVLNK